MKSFKDKITVFHKMSESYIPVDSFEVTGKVLDTEEKIKNEWIRLRNGNLRVDGLPDTYEEFRDAMMIVKR